MPKGVRLKPEQIVAKLREIEVKIGQGKDVLTACCEAGATDKSYYRWRREYGGMKVDQAKRLKQLEQENARLKRLVGELHLEKAVLTDVARGNWAAAGIVDTDLSE
jgi:putative transposase